MVLLLFLLFVALTPSPGWAYQSSPARQEAPEAKDWGSWMGPWRARVAAMMPVDFGEQYLYAAANTALPPPAPGERRVVFIGDSITDGWDLARFFPGKPYVDRGISGQVTPQMLARFHADVIALRPTAVVILGGINDLGGALQVETDAQIEANYEAMAEIAQAHGIKVIFTAILPVNSSRENARAALEDSRLPRIDALNRWLKAYCQEKQYDFIDYGPALSDANGLLAAEFSADGLHPNDLAYARMAPIAEQAIETTLAR